MADRSEPVILTNMCMIYDDAGNILVQDRQSKTWGGVTFPGGHVELGESIVASTIREVYEETGLTIDHLQICGTKQFFLEDGTRYIVFFYRTNQFSGTLKASEEGPVYWLKAKDLPKQKVASSFLEMYQLFIDDSLSEAYYLSDNKTLKLV